MNFVSREHFNTYLKKLKYLGEGRQGICYLRKEDNTVFKVFHDYFDNESSEYTKEFLLRFSNIKNSTFIWPNDIITVKNEIVGYTMPYKKSKNLYEINPLLVNLNILEDATIKAEEDVKLLTDNKVKLYDVRYNILYLNGTMNIIDTLEYSSREVTYEENRQNIDEELMLFLVDNYFDNFVKSDKILKEMYMEFQVRGVDFLRVFRRKLSEYMDKDIVKLNEAKKLVRRNSNNPVYIRGINVK